MCGIAGIISFNNKSVQLNQLKKMTDIIAHRGPDGEGHWVSSNGNVALGHRRLSIIDLSHEADQPMHYLGRYTIVFNGEIYNYLELKQTLIKQGYHFKTNSDTEVLMALYDRDKLNCLQILDGMFAFAIYDTKDNTIFIAKDRFGEKPFYYSYKQGEYFYFGSELKCLWEGGIKKEVNNSMLFNYLLCGVLENSNNPNETFFLNCIKLPHAHYLKLDLNKSSIKIQKYYDISNFKINNTITLNNACEQFKELFFTSVKRRLRSDVTVGSSLSGGLDSSLVVCVIDELNKSTNQKQNTFSAVFPGFEKDERKYMDFVINQTNANAYFCTPNSNGLVNDIDKLCWHQEEPFGSASIYAQYCVMKNAKQNNTTVLLDGQGADEVLAGYHYFYKDYFNELKKVNNNEYNIQYNAYTLLHKANKINGLNNSNLAQIISNKVPKLYKPFKLLSHKINQFTNSTLNKDFYYQNINSLYLQSKSNFITLNQSLYNATFNLGLQELLRYCDRNSMANSIEVRLPFLYHELVEFLFSLPPNFKINNGWTKWIMRETFDELPKEIGWRVDKIGYEPPQDNWMTNKLIVEKIEWNKSKLVNAGILNKKTIGVSNSNKTNWKYWMAAELL